MPPLMREWIVWLSWFVPSVAAVVFLVIQGWGVYAIAIANGVGILIFVLCIVMAFLDPFFGAALAWRKRRDGR